MNKRPFTGVEPGESSSGRLTWAAIALAGALPACEALLRGLPVPRAQLNPEALAALEEPAEGPDMALDEELALRLEVRRHLLVDADGGEQAGPPPAEPFEGLAHDDVLALTFEAERHLVDDLIEAGTVGTFAGVPETFKSWQAQALAVRVAHGEGEILGRAVTAQGPVGYFWQDDSRRNEAERVQVYSAAHDLPEGLPLRWFLNEGLELPRDLLRLRATVERFGLLLVVLDSFYNFATGISLKEEDAAAIVAALKAEVCDPTGCAVLVVDHAPWPSDANRGQRRAYGSVLKGAAVRWGVYFEREGSKFYVSARGNNVRGLKRSPAAWDEEALELRLVDVKPSDDEAAVAAARAWLAEFVAAKHAETGAGVSKTAAVEAYHEAHGGRGRNLARRVIDAELELAEAAADAALRGESTGGMEHVLIGGIGGKAHGKYLYPADHAASLAAAPPIGGIGGNPSGALEEAPPADAAATPKGEAASGGYRSEGGEGAPDVEQAERLLERHADLAGEEPAA